jgi:dihydroorotate dehydrogenase
VLRGFGDGRFNWTPLGKCRSAAARSPMNSRLYKNLLRQALFRMDPEEAHHFAMAGLCQIARSRFARAMLMPRPDPQLERTVFGLKFPNPIGLAAGFDKDAMALGAWETLGFGFVEAGTITAHAQPGNPRPRIFRLPEQEALINRMGFNNVGAEAVAARLRDLRNGGGWPRIPVGLNIGKSRVVRLENAVADYLASFEQLHFFGDYFVLNVSSPNTPGLRTLQNRAGLEELLGAIQQRNLELAGGGTVKPMLIKIAPDLEWPQIEEIIALAEAHRLAGIIATNTTIDQRCVPENRRTEGGLSGRPLRERATEVVRFVAAKTKLPVVAVGGIGDATSAREKLDAGAVLIQIYTAFIYEGPFLIRRILKDLARDV